ncbi:MAG: hypothetical protein RI932_175 [Pseudomonadota bacterium]|jgi:hypothetical protein
MRVIFWGRMLPKVVESVVNELSNGTRKLQICIQVDPAVKASEFSSPYLDEVIRENAFSFDALERKLVERREPALLVLDLWGFLFVENVLKLMQDLRPAFNLARRTLILMPKTWLGQWEDSSTSQGLSRSLRQEMNQFSKRLVGAFEVLWNTDGPEIYCVQSSPTFELLELVTGQVGLAPRKVLGIHLLPKECRNQAARFTSVAKLTHEVLSFLNLPIPAPGEKVERDGVAPWVCPVDADILYGPVQPKGEGRSSFARLSPELIAAGVQSRTPSLEQGLLTMSCRWDRYVRVEAGKRPFWAIPPAAVGRTGVMNFPSPEAAAWLHMLGILEQSAPQGLSKRGSSVDGQSTFPSIYQPLSHDNLDETVMS